MKKLLKVGVASAVMIAFVTAQPVAAKERHKHHKDNDAAAAILAGVIGLGVGVAIAKHGKNHDNDYQWDYNQYGQPFSPANNVYCYPRQRTCYRNGHIAYKWTRKVFGEY